MEKLPKSKLKAPKKISPLGLNGKQSTPKKHTNEQNKHENMLRNEDSNTTRYMCRHITGAYYGYACEEHALKCVICAGSSKLERPVKVCDDCSSRKTNTTADSARPLRRCIVCDTMIKGDAEPSPAMYCRYCVLLERDRDGCPTTMGTLQVKKDQQLRLANVVIN